MKGGRPRAKANAVPGRGRPRSQKPDRAATARSADPDATAAAAETGKGRSAGRGNFLTALLGAKDVLTSDDLSTIRKARKKGLSIADLNELVALKVRLAGRLFEGGQLDAKALMVSLDKSGAALAAVLQLGASGDGKNNPREMLVSWDDAQAPTAAGMPGREQVQRAAPGATGDVIETEG